MMVGLFAEELGLVGQGNGDGTIAAFGQEALAAEARAEAGVHGPVDEVFFFIAQFGQVFLALFYIQVAGTAGAYATAVVMQFNIVLQRHFQQALVAFDTGERYRLQSFLLKAEINRVHLLVVRFGLQKYLKKAFHERIMAIVGSMWPY
jgi:hypothetical protein